MLIPGKRHGRVFACLLTAFLLVVLSALTFLPLPAAPASAEEPATEFYPEDLPAKGNPKLDSALNRLVAGNAAAAPAPLMAQQQQMPEGTVRVIIEAAAGQAQNVANEVAAFADVEVSYGDLVQVSVPVSQLEALAGREDVRLVREPMQPLEAATSEGVALVNADDWQTAGSDGSGVKIGILDGGFSGYAALQGSELPASPTTHWSASYGNEGTSSHGTACAEIVYDMAPAATYYFANFSNFTEYGDAVDWLITQGVDIISCSVGWPTGGPNDGTGPVCDVVDTARAAGIFWAQSAGNSAKRHYYANYYDPEANGDHNFSGSDVDNNFTVNEGDIIRLGLKWDDTWGASGNNYSLWLYRGGNYVTHVDNIQNGNDDPYEFLYYTATVGGAYSVRVVNAIGYPDVNFHLYSYNHDLEYTDTERSIIVPATSPNAMAVGAIDYSTPTTLEFFSSRGPTDDARTKPDIVAPDGVSTATSSPFYGTSAAAPHVAGAAAQVLERYPSYTPTQIQSFLEGRAVDLGAGGKDNLYGSGRLDMGTPGYTLTMAASGNGTITPAAGSHNYDIGTTVNISAAPDTGWAFSNWAGDVSTVGNVNAANTTITMNADYTVTANFTTTVLTMAASGNGTVTPAAGSHNYAPGATVNVTATPAANWAFSYWTGGVTDNTSASTSVTMDTSKTVTAYFTQTSANLTMSIIGGGSTTPAAGSHNYALGATVNITGTADTGWIFDDWSGDTGTIANPNMYTTSIIMNGDYFVTANFFQPILTLSVSGNGTTTPAPGAHTYPVSTVNISAAAAPNSNWRFNNWTGGGGRIADVDSANTTINLDTHVSITANFEAFTDWNTFLGGSSNQWAEDLAVDADGNVYVVGYTMSDWGTSPVRAYTADEDIFVAKLNPGGTLAWHTFLGGAGNDIGYDIKLDSSGNVFIAGSCGSSWGTPLNAHASSGSLYDAVVAKLNGSSGALLWHTFLGGAGSDQGHALTFDSSGNICLTGHSGATWGSPVNAYTASTDIMAAKLTSSGSLVWNTFYGSASNDSGQGIAVDSADNIYLSGTAYGSWGSPNRAYTPGAVDAFAARLTSSGNLTWNTFLGGISGEESYGITVDSGSNAYLLGSSYNTTWASVPDAAPDWQTFVTKLDSSGNITWHSFFGGSGEDYGRDIVRNDNGELFVAGFSTATWGSPVSAYNASTDGYVAKLDAGGNVKWHTFVGSSGHDRCQGIALDTAGSIYMAGYSEATWGSDPGRAYTASTDAFAVWLGDNANLTMAVSGSGSTTPSAGTHSYLPGIVVDITAAPASGWQFAGWSSGVASTSSTSTTVTMNASKTITATFTQLGGGVDGGGGGGGGGAGGAGSTNLHDYLNAEGMFMIDATAESGDKKVTVCVEKGTFCTNKVGSRLTHIIIKMPDTRPPAPTGSSVVGETYDLGPGGAIFLSPITINFEYDPEELPEGASESGLTVYTYDNVTKQWTAMESTVDTENHVVSAKVTHFSLFTVMTGMAPASFSLSALDITPAETGSGGTVTVSLQLANIGDLSGNYTAEMTVDDVLIDTQLVSLAGSASRTVSFEVVGAGIGEHIVRIGGLEGAFSVTAAPASFKTEGLEISPRAMKIAPGETVTVTVNLYNSGEAAGYYEAVLKVDAEVMEKKQLTLYGGEIRPVSFTVALDEPGEHTVEAGGLMGTVIVAGEAAPPEQAPLLAKTGPSSALPEEEPMPDPITGTAWWPYASAACALLIIGGLATYLIRRRT